MPIWSTCFIVLEREYDSVPQEFLWEVLIEYGVRVSPHRISMSKARAELDLFPIGVDLKAQLCREGVAVWQWIVLSK